jgi:acetyl/propionyl-CoA carboxylase alpha subunit
MRPIRKLLVANRGEIASRVFRTCREMGIATVAVYSEADVEMPFVQDADEAVALGGRSAAESYLRVDAILAAARAAGADAVHPGYGFLAESAAFARSCTSAGLVFVGPPEAAIALMGSKLRAREHMQAAGVPVLPGLAIARLGPEPLRAAAESFGWPVLIKASAGGGGKGMRVVSGPEELDAAVAAAEREAAAAFGDGALLLERYVPKARHVEIQVFGDGRGHVVSLFERECSLQRRHQKIVEESPSPALDPPLREAMGAAALAAAKAVHYVGAGTVEFLLAPDRAYFFLEMNTRLQVEHSVTECVTGLDLVRLQILVAQGEALPENALQPRKTGHAIEVRLYAEDPRRDYLPATGRIERFRVPAAPGVRVDAGIAEGSSVGVHYDPLLAKITAHAATRQEAAQKLAAAVAGMQLHGIASNRDLLLGLLRHPEFLRGEIDTQFLERRSPAELCDAVQPPELDALHAAAAALARAAERRQDAPVAGFAPSGWRNNPSQPQQASFEGSRGSLAVAYAFHREGLELSVNGVPLPHARLLSCTPESVELELDGMRRRYGVHGVGDTVYVDSPLGHSVLHEPPRFPLPAPAEAAGTLLAPLPGIVARLAVRVGDSVEAGALVAILEAMKMEHRVSAPRAGRVSALHVREGQTVDAGTLLLVVTSD